MTRKDEGQVMHTWAGLRNAPATTDASHDMAASPLGENGSQGSMSCRVALVTKG